MPLPNRIGRHQIRGRIGAGGFATVWRAYDADLDDDVAVKVLAENWVGRADIRDRFTEEARILRRADSDRVIRVHDIGTLPDGRPYFVMTYADGGTLADRITDRRLPAADALRLIEEIARSVAELHDIGILHRDVKPSNILFRSTAAGRERVLIADLGVAKALAHASGLTSVAGSPGYMAPEQAAGGHLDSRADVYALGAVAYEILTGSLPTRGRPVPPSQLRTDLDAGVDDAVLRALATDRELRHRDAAAFADAVAALRTRGERPPTQAAAPVQPIQPSPSPAPPPAQQPWPQPQPQAPPHPQPFPPPGAVVSPHLGRSPVPPRPTGTLPRRPRTVLTASILTFLGSPPLVAGGVLLLIAMGASVGDTQSRLFAAVPNSVVYGVTAAVFFATCALSVVLALRTLWAHGGARIALTALGVANIAFAVFATVRGVTWFAVSAVYITVVLVLYWTGGANAWFRRRP